MPTINQIHDSLAELRVPLADLQPYGKNPRRGNVDVIAESLARNGQYKPVVVRRETNEVLAGNHTLAAAKQLKWTELAATYVDVDDDHAARIVLVDNRSSDLAGYEDDVLAELLDSLPSLEGTGYDDDDLAALIGGLLDEPETFTDVDDAPEVADEGVPTISQEGDVWELGQHAVLCGDSTEVSAVFDALKGERPDAVWTDPPYGVSYVGGTKDKLTIQNDGAEGLRELLDGAFKTLATVCKAGAPVYIAHADTERMNFEGAMRDAGIIFRQNLVWVKHSLVMGRSDYHYKHEPILEGVAPGGPKDAGAEDEEEPLDHDGILYGFTPGGQGRLGRGGKRWFGDNKATTVFDAAKPKRNDVHPTMKPVELIRKMLKNSLPPRGLVLDLFGGSGSTLIAAHHHGARAVLVELDPRYVDVICRRWQEHTGIQPINRATGQPRDFTSAAA
ncbi:DNA methyltransferase [Aeromicrobium sp. Leaf291]|uniref:DNA methyltransferase n=1 Tax=Aeromicrobium sp. Leaf291 TaxID=1736325 RepID=UPI0006F4FDB2|nr:DNA methyltransferase [Aeromicrobium sp. Leaf291]KQP81748.1 hypothetical protein ASF35_16530 [Aeromicrobium sp. Leaf291]